MFKRLTRPSRPVTANALNGVLDAQTARNGRDQMADTGAEAERSFRQLHASNRFRARLYL
ncbi:MAG: hypothetical protein LJE62_03275 [Silicimonas sp.]|nr:hypothetical protein [Silicimonas sp.]